MGLRLKFNLVLGYLDDSADPALIQFRAAVAEYRRDYGTTGG